MNETTTALCSYKDVKIAYLRFHHEQFFKRSKSIVMTIESGSCCCSRSTFKFEGSILKMETMLAIILLDELKKFRINVRDDNKYDFCGADGRVIFRADNIKNITPGCAVKADDALATEVA